MLFRLERILGSSPNPAEMHGTVDHQVRSCMIQLPFICAPMSEACSTLLLIISVSFPTKFNHTWYKVP